MHCLQTHNAHATPRSALHPSMRTDWAAGWGRLLAPGGELLTMVYPVDPSRDAGALGAVAGEPRGSC